MPRRIPVWLAAPALASGVPAAAQPAEPFSFEDVDFTPACEPNVAFGRLLTVLFGPPIEGGGDPVIDEAVYNAVSATALHVLRLRREIRWHGLRLVEVRALNGVESGPSNLSLVFADSPERVREVWNARGWNLPLVGEQRVIDDEGVRVAVGIEADGALAVVTCFGD
jgi:hypothetical protein